MFEDIQRADKSLSDLTEFVAATSCRLIPTSWPTMRWKRVKRKKRRAAATETLQLPEKVGQKDLAAQAMVISGVASLRSEERKSSNG